MPELASWNGKISPLSEISIPATDRGFLFGDSVYELVRVYHQQAFLLKGHLDRLAISLAAIRITYPLAQLEAQISALLQASALEEGIIYVQITRGAAPRKHVPPADLTPNCLIYVQNLSRQPTLVKRQSGIKIATTQDLRHKLCHIKSTNLLTNVLALMDAEQQGYQEVLLLDEKGMVREGAHSNVAIIEKDRLVTPPLQENILPGITRQFILELAKTLHLKVEEQSFDMQRLLQASEVMLLGTTTELMPVIEIDGNCIADGKPGVWSQALAQAFDQAI
ncbi:MAG: aminotransferase class IV [Oligoflexus sp.]